jgi:hypothetical protein
MTPYRLASTPGADQALSEQSREMLQATFEVLPKQYGAFAASIAGGDDAAEGATLIVRANVFQPRRTRPVLAQGSPETLLPPDTTIEVDGPHAEVLVAAVLADGVDFWFTPKAGGFTVYADHDDYATIFATRQGPVSRVSEQLRLAGFTEVPGYRRKL